KTRVSTRSPSSIFHSPRAVAACRKKRLRAWSGCICSIPRRFKRIWTRRAKIRIEPRRLYAKAGTVNDPELFRTTAVANAQDRSTQRLLSRGQGRPALSLVQLRTILHAAFLRRLACGNGIHAGPLQGRSRRGRDLLRLQADGRGAVLR